VKKKKTSNGKVEEKTIISDLVLITEGKKSKT